jgi:hypothetical protein
MRGFQSVLRAVTACPCWLTTALQAVDTRCPSANVHARLQPSTGSVPVLVTVTSAWKFVAHWLTTR